ncbi:MAG: hypothetical protein WBR18_08080, partial [Anaerolineales bacterium]
MRSYLVVLTGSQDSWQAAFTGYDLAVRGGARLIGAVPSNMDPDQDTDRLLSEFEIGARAAGATFVTQKLTFEADSLIGGLPADLRGVLMGRGDLQSEGQLSAMIESLTCPLWMIHRRRTLINALAILEGESATWFKPIAEQVAHEWGLHLETIDVGPIPTQDAPTAEAEQESTEMLEVNLGQFTRRLSAEPADLTLLAWPSRALSGWDLLHRSDRPLILVPA